MNARTGDAGRFATLLRGLRAAAGMTQEELAERAGLTAQAVGLLERGRRTRPHAATVQRLAEALGLDGPDARTLLAAARGTSGATSSSALPAPFLPASTDVLLGRDDLLARLGDLLRTPDVRLVTLTGPAGVGKSRTALEAAHRAGSDPVLATRFRDGRAYVALAAVDEEPLVLGAIATALGVPERAGEPVSATLVDQLRTRRVLLVLDNTEQLSELGELVARLLAACPGLSVMGTGRTPLRVTGEHQFPVPPLSADGVGSSAVELFLARARAVDPGFPRADVDLEQLAVLCRHLDGLPLAVELAAARAKLFSPSELLAALEASPQVLAGGPRDLAPHQRTLPDTIRWSYDLLGPAEQRAFRRLAVLSGPIGLSAARRVCDLSVEAAPSVLEVLSALVDWNLLDVDRAVSGSGSGPWFRMLRTTRAVALDLLQESGESHEPEAAREAHVLDLAATEQPERLDPRHQRWWWRPLEDQHEDIREVLRRALGRGDLALAVELSTYLWRFWALRHPEEGGRWLRRVYDVGAADPALVSTTVRPSRWAFLVFAGGLLSARQGDANLAQVRFEESLAAYRQLGHDRGASGPLRELAVLRLAAGEVEGAVALAQEALVLAERSGAELGRALAACTLTDAWRQAGRDVPARELLEASIDRLRGEPPHGPAANARVNILNRLGSLDAEQGLIDPAEVSFRESLSLTWRLVGTAYETLPSLVGLGRVAAARDRPAEAAILLGAAHALRERLGLVLPPLVLTELSDVAASVQQAAGTTYASLERAGRERPFAEIVAEVLGERGEPGPSIGS